MPHSEDPLSSMNSDLVSALTLLTGLQLRSVRSAYQLYLLRRGPAVSRSDRLAMQRAGQQFGLLDTHEVKQLVSPGTRSVRTRKFSTKQMQFHVGYTDDALFIALLTELPAMQ